jgi:hypothetical protein
MSLRNKPAAKAQRRKHNFLKRKTAEHNEVTFEMRDQQLVPVMRSPRDFLQEYEIGEFTIKEVSHNRFVTEPNIPFLTGIGEERKEVNVIMDQAHKDRKNELEALEKENKLDANGKEELRLIKAHEAEEDGKEGKDEKGETTEDQQPRVDAQKANTHGQGSVQSPAGQSGQRNAGQNLGASTPKK